MGLHGISRIGCCCRGTTKPRAPVLIWMILDEDTAAYAGYANQGFCGCYEEDDTAFLNAMMDKYPIMRGTAHLFVVENFGASYGFFGRFEGIYEYKRDVHRNTEPAQSWIDWFKEDISDYGRWPDQTIHFHQIVDNSGSMTTNTIQPGWGRFLTWLNNDFPLEDDRVAQVTGVATAVPERWIMFIGREMRVYLQNMGLWEGYPAGWIGDGVRG